MLLEFDGIRNARDLGGIMTMDGHTLKSGRMIRCGHLHDASEKDREKLSGMVDTIVDFRTDEECHGQPDQEVAGARHVHLPVLDTLTPGVTREERSYKEVMMGMLTDPAAAREYMCGTYRTFTTSELAMSQYSRFIKLLLEPHEKAVLWHCTAGKDRAGMGTAIVLEMLGVSRETIVEDYLSTNIYLKDNIDFLKTNIKLQAKVSDDKAMADEALQYLFGADLSYIEAFYETIEDHFGSMDRYLREGLKITDEEIARLRESVLE